MLDTLTDVHIGRVDAPARLAWAEGQRFTVPKAIGNALETFKGADGRVNLDDSSVLKLSFEYAEQLKLHAAFTDCKPASSRLPVSYQAVPQVVRTAIGSFMGRLARRRTAQWARFPGWPLDLSSDFLADLLDRRERPERSGAAPVILSHDLDTAEGLRNLQSDFLPIEERYGARSVNYVVPCAWPIDRGRLDDVRERGHEIGIHGYDHSNKTAFSSRSERRQRLQSARELIDAYEVTGYRAPSLLRTPGLLEDLSALYRHDSSIPTSGGRFPVPNNGCASARPFPLKGLVEIPLSLPRDGSLLFLGHSPGEILELWTRCADAIAEARGVVTLLTHCETRFSGNSAMRETYDAFLRYLSESDRFRFAGTTDAIADAL